MTRPRKFTLRRLFLIMFLFALALGIWHQWSRPVMFVRAARDEDALQSDYFALDSGASDMRNIAVVKGRFFHGTNLRATLYAVRAGRVEMGNTWHVGVNSWADLRPWKDLTLTMALGDEIHSEGTTGPVSDVKLGIAGELGRGSGHGDCIFAPVLRDFVGTWSGRVVPGRKYVIYAEGSAPPKLRPDTTVEDIAARRDGEYLVVEVEVE